VVGALCTVCSSYYFTLTEGWSYAFEGWEWSWVLNCIVVALSMTCVIFEAIQAVVITTLVCLGDDPEALGKRQTETEIVNHLNHNPVMTQA
jgi:hypothetical protein